ncbi:hypothetical protein [Streptomyces sp. NPDC091879]|uniref:hypothetical protein n=1 Tax=Streptomyces sp. NPDC091879 TaxID=3366006 RepID=UPI0038070E73
MRDAPMNNYVLVFVVTVYSAVVLVAAWGLVTTRAELDKRLDELVMQRRRLKETEEQALALVDKVTPLIEKTDWMTGRWQGQFSTLVHLENKRNAKVDTARRAIWEIPIVRDHIERSITDPRTNNGENQ